MTRKTCCNSLVVLVAATACLVGQEAQAQFGQTQLSGFADDNVAAAGARDPGIMVRSGVARAQTAINRSMARIEITEPDQPDTIRPNAISQSLEGFLTQFNRVLSELLNLLIARAGGTPSVATPPSTG